MQVICPRCSQPIPTEDVNVARVVAKCRACGAVFNFEDQLSLPKPTGLSPIRRVALPPGVELSVKERSPGDPYRAGASSAGELTLSWRWFTTGAIGELFFITVWFGFLGFWYKTAFDGRAPWIFFVFPLIHVGVGLVVLHRVVAAFFNRTTVRIAEGRLTIHHAPIPTFSNRDIPLHELRQLFTVTKKGSKGDPTYEVHATTTVGPTVKLVTGLKDMQQAAFLEATIEDHLGIEDDPALNQGA